MDAQGTLGLIVIYINACVLCENLRESCGEKHSYLA